MEASSSNYFQVVLLLLAFTSNINTISAAGRGTGKTSTEFIKSSCTATTYPNLCFTSLSSHANTIQTSPKLLAHTALSITLDTARSTSAMMLKLSQTNGLKPREIGAMRDCVEELSDSVDLLSKSLGEMNHFEGSKNLGLLINDVQTWVSAALTDENTCMDGFGGESMNGNTKSGVRGQILSIAHLTSNALALVNSYASYH